MHVFVSEDFDHQNDSTERVLKEARRMGAEIAAQDHQNDSTERVLKEELVQKWYLAPMGPSKRLDRASTERDSNQLERSRHLLDHQNDSTERVLKEESGWASCGAGSLTIKTTRQSEY